MNRIAWICIVLAAVATGWSQSAAIPVGSKHPAIQYLGSQPHDAVSALNVKLLNGTSHLEFDRSLGYLPAVLDALHVPVESQMMVFSKTSLQTSMIGPDNPRAIFFSDSVAVAYIRDSPTLEVIAQDPQLGAIFYTIPQQLQTQPHLLRETTCLGCHETAETLNVTGMVVRSVFPTRDGAEFSGLAGSPTDHRTPFEARWGGWYVSGKHGPLRHVGNAVVRGVNPQEASAAPAPVPVREPLPEKFSAPGYRTPYSDVVALGVFEHQMHMMNLITRIGWEARVIAFGRPAAPVADMEGRLRDSAKEVVDYMLFVDEAPFTGRLDGNSGFAEKFSLQGPVDNKGRSLRQLDLNTRLMRYPCSYLIYSDAFNSLLPAAKNAIFLRMVEILSGQEKDPKYQRLSVTDRAAIVEILRDTIRDLPESFGKK